MIKSFGNHSSQATSNNVSEEKQHFEDATPSKPAATSFPPGYLEEQVYQFIQTGKSTQWGFSKGDCAAKFKTSFSESDVYKAIDQLLDDARIYDTGDEIHFKSIE